MDLSDIESVKSYLNTINDNCGDPRIFENIFNSLNEVVDDYYMWLTVYEAYSPPYIEIVFQNIVNLSAVKIWNYNKYDELEPTLPYVSTQFAMGQFNRVCRFAFGA